MLDRAARPIEGLLVEAREALKKRNVAPPGACDRALL
jgi:hypothetical protein